MSSFVERTATSNKAQLAATALVSGALVATAILGYQRAQQHHHHQQNNPRRSRRASSVAGTATQPISHGKSVPLDQEDLRNQALARRAQAGDYDDELILEQLARNRVFLTDGGLEKLRNSFVVVVGCGGVGSHCTAALARSGVSKIRLIDFDQVTLSSLNRHAVATLADVGIPKVQCLQRRLAAIAPWVQFDMRQEKYWEPVADRLLETWTGTDLKPDFVVDAIDNIDTKVSLLKYCHDHGLPVISAMGAGCKSDPTRIMVGDIGIGTDDRLSRATRRRLKLLGITKGIPTVFSTEKTGDGKAELLPLPEDEFAKGKVGDLGVLPEFRVRILPVLGTMPAVFGYTVANHVILSITGYPTDYATAKGRDKLYDGLLAAVQGGEERMLRHLTNGDASVTLGLKVPITPADMAFLAEDIYKARSAITGLPTRLTLIRWKKPTGTTLIRIGEGADEQKSSNLKLGDLVCMTKEEATRHDKLILRGDQTHEDLYDSATISKVEALMNEAASYEKYR
ncbi:ubiquitin-protein ligase molybdopterin-converting factor [Microdochium trichocladiopsis]|uniref:Ubiquitin-protein ligase molybdopterin-converting factor n=1 Tax=Microdochium trichocladiopsis TaxID=1682393 RepID=A0A9P8YE90_9PEZI|nr:ubiquitin-protein ligase molybdopterin-converting factor [Microdochium trichocladiopsis]KAH7037282.1 ubiquitin-protein ligase molybdopterin-converting factor [Microdochium trichocladiopsis]